MLDILLQFLFLQNIYCSDSSVPGTLLQRINQRRGYMVPINSQITLSCPFETPFYKWSRSEYPSHLLEETKNITIVADSVYVSGRYQCSAVNGFGNSLAEMAVRVIDEDSPSLKRECALTRDGQINKAGPCFFKSYSDAELSITLYWGEDAVLDCSSVTADGLTYQLNYAWEFYKQGPDSQSIFQSERLTRSQLNGRAGVNTQQESYSPQFDISRYSESQLPLKKATLNRMGRYRCTVTNPLQDASSAVNNPKISRTFQVNVIPRSEGAIIQGDHEVSVRIKKGDDLRELCKVSADQHRAVTIRWGKKIDERDRVHYKRENSDEIIRLSNSTFVVFPSISPSANLAPGDLPNPVAVSEVGSSESSLIIRQISTHDAGLYICSALIESGRDDRKFVRVIVSDSQFLSVDEDSTFNSSPYKLTLYICAPVTMFLICLCILSYCLISHRSRRAQQSNGNRSTRAVLPTKTLQISGFRKDQCSALSSISMGNTSRTIANGKSIPNSIKTNTGPFQEHVVNNSPQTNNQVHSSSSGPHSISGTSIDTQRSMLLANTMAQVLPPDGTGYLLMKPNGHARNGYSAQDSYQLNSNVGINYAAQTINGYHDYSGHS